MPILPSLLVILLWLHCTQGLLQFLTDKCSFFPSFMKWKERKRKERLLLRIVCLVVDLWRSCLAEFQIFWWAGSKSKQKTAQKLLKFWFLGLQNVRKASSCWRNDSIAFLNILVVKFLMPSERICIRKVGQIWPQFFLHLSRITSSPHLRNILPSNQKVTPDEIFFLWKIADLYDLPQLANNALLPKQDVLSMFF